MKCRFYLALNSILFTGIQQYLYENGRIDNIFTDPYYEKFTDCLDDVAKKFSVLYNDSRTFYPYSLVFLNIMRVISSFRIYCDSCRGRAPMGMQATGCAFTACSAQYLDVL